VIVAIEGLDGSGKTTVGKLLAGAIGATYVTLPPPKLKLAGPAIFEDLTSESRYAYYLSGVAAIAEMARDLPLLVADRYLASAHAMHLDIRTPLADALRRLPLPEADLTFFLHVTDRERRRRLRTRGRDLDTFEQRLNADSGFRRRVELQMCTYERTHIVDTTTRRPEAVAEAVQQVWEEATRSDGD
jgi:UMP-CMP kinase 2